MRALRLAVVALALAASGAAAHAAGAAVQLDLAQAIGLATRLLVERRLEEAGKVLDGLARIAPGDPQVFFLRGQLAFARGEYRAAASLYRLLLSRNPLLVRVRLELARALFFAHDYEAARYHFRIALGQTLERRARENIYRFLRAIDGRSSWLSLSVVVGPDSNPAFATDEPSVVLLGNVFMLDQSARARRSLGTVIDGRGRYAFGQDRRDFIAAAFQWRDYAGSYADFQALEVTAGRTKIVGESLWTTELGPLGAWYRGRSLYQGALFRLTHARPYGARVLASSYLSAKRLDYADYPTLSADQLRAGASLRYALGPAAACQGSLTLGRSVAREAPYSYRAVEAMLGCEKELPAHFNVALRLTASRYSYDAPEPLFGLERLDRMQGIDLEVTARDWSIAGFAPKLVLSASRNDSNLPLYRYERSFLGVGMTREF